MLYALTYKTRKINVLVEQTLFIQIYVTRTIPCSQTYNAYTYTMVLQLDIDTLENPGITFLNKDVEIEKLTIRITVLNKKT